MHVFQVEAHAPAAGRSNREQKEHCETLEVR
jgi:hypothetical protein